MNLIMWIRQICGFLILSSILKNVLAQSKYNAHMKLFMNLLLVLMLAQPLMNIDLEQLDGTWKEVSADLDGNWRNKLAQLAETELSGGQTREMLMLQVNDIVKQKGYQLEDLVLRYDEYGEMIQEIEIIVSEMEEYIREPIIWSGSSYAEGPEEILEKYLDEVMKPAVGVKLYVRIH